MTTEQIVEAQIKALVNHLTPEARDKIVVCVANIRKEMDTHGTVEGINVGDIAIAIIGSELAAKG